MHQVAWAKDAFNDGQLCHEILEISIVSDVQLSNFCYSEVAAKVIALLFILSILYFIGLWFQCPNSSLNDTAF